MPPETTRTTNPRRPAPQSGKDAAAAREAADEHVRDALIRIGIDARHPIEVQSDMRILRKMRERWEDEEFHDDMNQLRKWRKLAEAAKSRGVMILMTLLVTALVATVWVGFKEKVKPDDGATSQIAPRYLSGEGPSQRRGSPSEIPPASDPYKAPRSHGSHYRDAAGQIAYGYRDGPMTGPQ